MQTNLIRYTRSNDRRMVLRSLKDVKFLSCLTLDPVQTADGPLSDLEKEVAEENIVLNGVPFKPVGLGADGKEHGSNAVNSSLPMLKGLCSQFCERPNVDLDQTVLYEKLIIRMAKTTASADPYFRLNSLLGSSDLLVMPIGADGQGVPATTAATSISTAVNNKKDFSYIKNPIHLNVYETHNEIHVTLSEAYTFGLFRKSDVKSARPWIIINAVVNERANISSDQSVRHLTVKLPDLY